MFIVYADLSQRISESTSASKSTEDASKRMDAIGEQVSDVHYWGFRFVTVGKEANRPNGDFENQS